MYNKAEICKTANELIKQGSPRSDAFVEAWRRAKNEAVRANNIQTSTQGVAEESSNLLLEKVREYKELQKAIEELEEKAKDIKVTIVDVMEEQQAEEIKVDIFKVRYTTIVSNRFNTTEFKKTHNTLYEQYLKENVCKRFTIV